MNLVFEKVLPNDVIKIAEVYEIIKNCGEEMSRNQGLNHWKTPYPISIIEKNCCERDVFLIRDLEINQYVHTFQLELNTSKDKQRYEENVASIHKFATNPLVAGRGIGKQSMEFIENYCLNKNVSKLCLDVYEKNEHAIQFYISRGFKVTGKKPTRHFVVHLMEKKLK